MKLFKLKFKSSIHLGEREGFLEGTETTIHSDTLFSALCNSYLLLYGRKKLECLLENFKNEPPFFLSSAFPYWKDKYFFPIPLSQFPKEKEQKKLSFIEKDGFEKILEGENIENLHKKYETIPSKDEKSPYKIIKNPRVSLGRLNNYPGENFFYFGETFFEENSGLFFLVKFNDNSFEKEFNSALNLMQDEGIGGDRTVGKGFFNVEANEEFKIKFPENPNGFMTLSIYSPRDDEIDNLDGFFEIIERSGYIYSPYGKNIRRKSIRVFKEGSVFSKNKKGRLVDITPSFFKEHKIYRFCYAFTIPLKGVEYEN